MHQGQDMWQLKAACRGPQAAVFFPPSHAERKEEKASREMRAKTICDQCRAHRRLAHAALAGNDDDVALCAEGTHVHAGPSVVAGPHPQIDRRPKILVTPLESDHPRR